jgi:hypothetical protein
MELKDFPEWHDVVSRNWHRTTGYLLSFREPCISIQASELEAIRANRVLVGLDAASLGSWHPQESWMLGVLLCHGDTAEPVVRWIRAHRAAPERVRFYAHARADPFAALAPWHEAGLPDPTVDTGITSWQVLHKRFGTDLSVRILKDWG